MKKLQDRLNEFKAVFESGAPPYHAPREAIDLMHRATAELKQSGIEGRSLQVGERVPAFRLLNQDQQEVATPKLLGEGILLVSFFRGHW
jgi:hypothetical protein